MRLEWMIINDFIEQGHQKYFCKNYNINAKNYKNASYIKWKPVENEI